MNCRECGHDIAVEESLGSFSYQRCEVEIVQFGLVTVSPPSAEVAEWIGQLMMMAHPSTYEYGDTCEHTGAWFWDWSREGGWVTEDSWNAQARSVLDGLREAVTRG